MRLTEISKARDSSSGIRLPFVYFYQNLFFCVPAREYLGSHFQLEVQTLFWGLEIYTRSGRILQKLLLILHLATKFETFQNQIETKLTPFLFHFLLLPKKYFLIRKCFFQQILNIFKKKVLITIVDVTISFPF